MMQHVAAEVKKNVAKELAQRKCRAANCSRSEGLKPCGACFVVAYCSKQCQRRDWSVHKGFCCGKGPKDSELKRLMKRL